MDPTHVSLLIGITSLFAATVNGALGYGYSSITVPISLLMVTSRVLNPALVIVEVVVNLYALLLARRQVRTVWPRVAPIAIGILPGVVIGSLVLASISPDWAKVITYGTLLPLIWIQGAGLVIPIRNPRVVGVPFGASVGLLYSITTISGPPLALYFNNAGMDKSEFRVALALTRSIESITTLLAYAALGMLTAESTALVPWLAPGVVIGLPFGIYLIRHLKADVFRRACITFDAWLVGFGLARVVIRLDLVPVVLAYQTLTIAVLVDALLLRRYFAKRAALATAQAQAPPPAPG